MRQVADNFCAAYHNDFTSFLGFTARDLGEPRMFSGRICYHFGGGSEAPAEAIPYTSPPATAPAAPVARS